MDTYPYHYYCYSEYYRTRIRSHSYRECRRDGGRVKTITTEDRKCIYIYIYMYMHIVYYFTTEFCDEQPLRGTRAAEVCTIQCTACRGNGRANATIFTRARTHVNYTVGVHTKRIAQLRSDSTGRHVELTRKYTLDDDPFAYVQS